MNTDSLQVVRIVKRLNEALGYFELGMAQHAIGRLNTLDAMGDLGPFRIAAAVIRAEVLKGQNCYDAAAEALETAARALPPPYDQSVWFALSMCYRQAGDTEHAINSMGCARGAKPPQVPSPGSDY